MPIPFCQNLLNDEQLEQLRVLSDLLIIDLQSLRLILRGLDRYLRRLEICVGLSNGIKTVLYLLRQVNALWLNIHEGDTLLFEQRLRVLYDIL